jgi:outer membrane protein assembly factor BamB
MVAFPGSTMMNDWRTRSGGFARTRFASCDVRPPWKVLWEYDVGAPTASAEVTSVGGVVLAATNLGAVHAIDAMGSKLWVSDPGEGRGLCPKEPPVVIGQYVVVAMEGRLDCLSLENGQTLWSIEDTAGADFPRNSRVNLEHDFYQGVLWSNGDSILVGSRMDVVREIGLADGAIRMAKRVPIGRMYGAAGRIIGGPWERSEDRRIGWLDPDHRYSSISIGEFTACSPGCVVGELLVIPTDRALVAVDLLAGVVRWRHDYQHAEGDRRDHVMRIAADNACVYSARPSYLCAYSLEDGKRLWKSQAAGRIYRDCEPTVSPNWVYLTGRSDGDYCIDVIDKRTGEVAWTWLRKGDGTHARTVVIANNQAIVEEARRVTCYISSTA